MGLSGPKAPEDVEVAGDCLQQPVVGVVEDDGQQLLSVLDLGGGALASQQEGQQLRLDVLLVQPAEEVSLVGQGEPEAGVPGLPCTFSTSCVLPLLLPPAQPLPVLHQLCGEALELGLELQVLCRGTLGLLRMWRGALELQVLCRGTLGLLGMWRGALELVLELLVLQRGALGL